MRPRIFIPDLGSGSDELAVPPEELKHLVRVLRVRRGEMVSVFDGQGRELLARVASAGSRSVVLRPVGVASPAPETAVRITLAQAVLKGDSMDEVVRDAVMLGVAAIQPVVADRSEISLDTIRRGRRIERWQRIALSSVKQCGRAVLPPIHPAISWREYLEIKTPNLRLMLVEPSAAVSATDAVSSLAAASKPDFVSVLIGPEGGWTEAETREARARGFRLLTLGARTLRADAVPVAALSILLLLWGEL